MNQQRNPTLITLHYALGEQLPLLACLLCFEFLPHVQARDESNRALTADFELHMTGGRETMRLL